MEFRFQDILKNIIPGLLIISEIFYIILIQYPCVINDKLLNSLNEIKEISLVVTLCSAFIIGYLIDSLSSWFEHFILYRYLFPKPSFRVLNNNGRYCLYNKDMIITNIISKFNNVPDLQTNRFDKKHSSLLFKYANILKEDAPETIKNKTSEFYFSYIFSRNLLFSFFTIFIMSIICDLHFRKFDEIILVHISIISILLFRWLDKSAYYTRQVFLASKLS